MRITLFLPALALCALADAATVRFSKDIRPIFSDKCFTCHGPDASNRTTKLRLDTERGARIDSGSGRKIIVPGDPASSELYLRVSSGDPARRMPPAYAGHAGLTQSEIDLIETWIDQGAEWSGHWAFAPPQSPRTPAVRQADWVKNPIDAFVLKRLETEGLSPSPQAARETLIRRVSLDLNGLPPSLEEIDAFLADRSANAYEKVVDRLLSSPRYGERMAARWLDAARYADTNGYQTDAERYMWRWRDWVIDAFNANKPFDEFTVEQLAGDMLPNATLEQIVATGFNRNHRGNGEGGIVDAEYAVEYVVDRVDTTSTVWLGITMGCARCHDHKYDPFTQKEFYGMFAYFNNVPERGKAFKYGNSPPFVQAPTAEQQETLAAMSAEIDSLKRRRARLIEEGRRARLDWERSAAAAPADWTDARGQVAAWGSEAAEAFDGKRAVELGDIADFSFYDRFTASAWIRPAAADGAIVSRTRDIPAEEDTQSNPGWGFYLKDGRLQVNLVNRWLDDCLRIDSEPKVARNEWRHVAFTYDGSRLASGLNLYIDGKPVAKKIVRDEMNQEIKSKEPLTIGRGLGLGFEGLMERVSVWSRALTPEEIAVEAVRERIERLAAVPGERRSPAAQRKLDRAYANRFGPAELTALTAKIRGLEDERQRFSDSIPTVMVMRERRIPRKTYRLDRGAYDAPAEEVQPGAPAVLARQSPRNRLEFARWTASRDNPLTARVTVNRLWQMLFGTGIVKTVEDFGAQGEWPTHPQLLDWLAVEFMESGWDVKHILKTIVASAAYRQSSRTGGELIERDPENRLLARGPPLPPSGRGRPRPGAGDIGPAGGEDRRPVGQALSTPGTLERSGGHKRLPDGQRRESLSPQSLYVLETRRAPAGDDELRLRRPRSLYCARRAHEHAAPGAQPDERLRLRRSRQSLGRARHARGGRRRRSPPELRLQVGRGPPAEPGRTGRPGQGVPASAFPLRRRRSRGGSLVGSRRPPARCAAPAGRMGRLHDDGEPHPQPSTRRSPRSERLQPDQTSGYSMVIGSGSGMA